MIFVPITDENRVPWHLMESWTMRHWFYNHIPTRPDSEVDTNNLFETENLANPVGVLFEGRRYACLAVSGPVVIWACDHEAVSLPAKEYYALHPLLDD
jgi:hypothetical protein